VTEEGDNQEMQIAYQELVVGMQEGSISEHEFSEVLISFNLDPFSHIQLPSDLDT
jgi:hypothetical protein